VANMDLEDVVILGNGPRFDKINKKIDTFRTFSENSNNYLVWIGEGEPNDNVRMWIKKTDKTQFAFLIDEMKKCFFDKPNLEFVGVDNFNSISIAPKMCIIVSKQNIITTFQNPNDLDVFILDKLGVNNS
jgi:hypothetical protein